MKTTTTYQQDSIQQIVPVSDSSAHKDKLQFTNDTDVIDSAKVYGFENHELIPTRKVDKPKFQTSTDVEHRFEPSIKSVEIHSWQTVLLVVMFFLFGFIKAFNYNRFNQTYRAIFNYGVAQEIIREEKVFFHRVNLIFSLIYIVTTSLLVLLFNERLHFPQQPDLNLFLMIIGFLVIAYFLKYLVAKILFYVYNDNSLADEYVFNVSLYNSLMGVLFIPALSVAYFTELSLNHILNYIVIPILFIAFSSRILRLLVIGNSRGILYLHIILYICTLEILPLVVLYRIFIH